MGGSADPALSFRKELYEKRARVVARFLLQDVFQYSHWTMRYGTIHRRIMRKRVQKFIRWIKSFTLVELLVTIAIIGVLGSIVFVAATGIRQKAYDIRRKADMKNISLALEIFYNQQNTYPIRHIFTPVENLGLDLVTKPSDPSGVSYQYYSQDGQEYRVYLNLSALQDEWYLLYPSDQPGYNVAFSNRPYQGITLQGDQFVSSHGRWFTEAGEAYTFWGWSSLIYKFTIQPGSDYDITIFAKNHGDGDMFEYNGYHFYIIAAVDGQELGRIKIAGRKKIYSIGTVRARDLKPGTHTLQLTWINDSCPGCGVRNPLDKRFGKDANIRIQKILIRHVPGT